MTQPYAFENLLRDPWEILSGLMACGSGLLILNAHGLFALTNRASFFMAACCFLLGATRLKEGIRLIRYQRGLLKLRPYSLGVEEIPLSKDKLFLGKGFRFNASHRQRLHLLNHTDKQVFINNNREQGALGGKPWLHGVGADAEETVFLDQSTRNSHHVVFGMTRVGKTRLSSILINQDIRNGEAVLVLDPKGDTALVQAIYLAAKSVGKLKDLILLHAGYPDISAKYNPLQSFSSVSEVATRVTAAIDASGEGKQFRDFAWKFLNITASCLHEMAEPINYQSLAFYVTRPKQLLMAYGEKVLAKTIPNYRSKIEDLLDELQLNAKKSQDFTRADAAYKFVGQYIESFIAKDSAKTVQGTNLVELYQASQLGQEYYGKITASLGPVFDKINKTEAATIFSWDQNIGLPEIHLSDLINKKKIVYIGLNAMENRAMSEAVAKAVISDLLSLCGRIYRTSQNETSLCLHADEFSDIVQDDFITLLNKAGGAGIKITAYTQTYNDLGQAFNNSHKAKQLLGNFGTTTMLRIANRDTGELFTECLQQSYARSTIPVSMSNDRPYNNIELFNTNNSDQINESAVDLLTLNDLYSLPKGQAFTLTNGGTLYKVRFPLPKNNGRTESSVSAIMHEVNLCEV
jgi:conjugative coupling factor TraD (SXT/TOL subfamily)